MKKLSEAQLDEKIDSFLSKKLAQHPELKQTDGTKASKLWHVNPMARRTWRLLDGHRGLPS